MPMYTYRRADGTTFETRQKFTDEPLAVDPASGQPVVRLVQSAGIIFKGSGFYVTDSKSATRGGLNAASPKDGADSNGTKAEAPAAEAKAEAKPEGKAESKVEAKAPAATPTTAAAD